MKEQERPLKVAITGAGGIVGQAITEQLDLTKFKITPICLPEHDASNLQDLIDTTQGHDVLIHLAWKNLIQNAHAGTIDPINNLMTFNAYQAAVVNSIPRVIMGSSNHAHRYDLTDTDGQIRASIQPSIPNNPYGAEKIFMEALGRYFAATHAIGVICVRIGNVNEEDRPRPGDNPPRWLSHRDLGRLITCCLVAEEVPENFQVFYGVSKQKLFDWTNPFDYEPLDSAE